MHGVLYFCLLCVLLYQPLAAVMPGPSFVGFQSAYYDNVGERVVFHVTMTGGSSRERFYIRWDLDGVQKYAQEWELDNSGKLDTDVVMPIDMATGNYCDNLKATSPSGEINYSQNAGSWSIINKDKAANRSGPGPCLDGVPSLTDWGFIVLTTVMICTGVALGYRNRRALFESSGPKTN